MTEFVPPILPSCGTRNVIYLPAYSGRAPTLASDKYPSEAHVDWFPWYGDQQTKMFSSVHLHDGVLYVYDQSPAFSPDTMPLRDLIDFVGEYGYWECSQVHFDPGYYDDGISAHIKGWREMLPWEYAVWREDYYQAARIFDEADDFNSLPARVWVDG